MRNLAPHSEVLHIRLTDDEKARVVQAATAYDLTVSAYIRRACMGTLSVIVGPNTPPEWKEHAARIDRAVASLAPE